MTLSRVLKRLAFFSATCFLYGIFIEPNAFQVRRSSVPVLPSGAEKIRVLHISDAHLVRRNKQRLAFVQSLAGLEPDLVVCTGDLVSEAEAIEPLREALGRLLDVPGVYVWGSSDYEKSEFRNPLRYLLRSSERKLHPLKTTIPTAKLETALSSKGWINLTQERTQLTIKGTRLELRGTDDAHLARDDYPGISGKPASDTQVNIGVTHAPYLRVLNAMTTDDIQLIFAGHTHGGQVCIPIYGPLVTNCDLDRHHASGVSKWEAGSKTAWLNVSAGFGMSPHAPYRFACPPEVSLITLEPKQD